MARVRTVPDQPSNEKKDATPRKEKSPTPTDKKQAKGHNDELRHLQDSLSTFFTPTTGRRSRLPPRKFDDEEKIKEEGMKPLSIDTNCEPSGSSNSENQSTKSPAVSPARRACEKLMDSLSPYFSATSEKRHQRRASKSDSFVFPNESSSQEQSQPAAANSSFSPTSSTTGGNLPKKMKGRKGEDLKKVVGGRKTLNSASAALFGSPVDDPGRTTTGSSDTDAIGSPLKRTKKLRGGVRQEPEASPSPSVSSMKEKKKKKSAEDEDDSPSSSSNGEKENFSDIIAANGEIIVSEKSVLRFQKSQKITNDAIEKANREYSEKNHKPAIIRMGNKETRTWYSSPFPQEYTASDFLHICEFCLHYAKTFESMEHHRNKCEWRNPPGREIYRQETLSVFEVDGNASRIYCQNLCLIAKLFLDHKTLYYDVEPFLFYVATTNDEFGFHLVGYFSKEKYSSQKFNLSCIVTLPYYQKMGFGRFLIDFSFLLSRKEGLFGSPERPLSDLGKISYTSYWRTAVLEWLYHNYNRSRSNKLTIHEIAVGTGITAFDIIEVFEALQWFQRGTEGVELVINWSLVEAEYKRAKDNQARIWLDESLLNWVPVQHSPTKDFGMRSPVRLSTPHRSHNTTANVGSTPTGVSIAAVGSTIKKGCAPPKSSKKRAARRKLALVNRKTGSSSDSDNEPSPSEKQTSFKELIRVQHNESSDTEFEQKLSPKKEIKNTNGIIGRQTNNSASTSASFRTRTPKGRGKDLYENNRLSSSSSDPSDDDDKDESFELGRSKGKKPQKGKVPPVVKRRKPAPKKPGKSPGKVFPPNYGRIEPGTSSSPVARCDSAASSATIPMRQGQPGTPGGGVALDDDLDDMRAPTLTRISPLRHPRQRQRTASDSTTPRSSDSSLSRPRTSRRRFSRSSTPPRQHQEQQFINIGGIPAEDAHSRSRAMSVESDQPPQLHAIGGHSSDEAPPHLPAENGDIPPLLTAADAYDDDEAPPQLSPVITNGLDLEREADKQPHLTEEQRQLVAMDQPPKAPIKQMDEEHMNSFDNSVQSIMEPSSSKSMMAQSTPLNTYPNSLKQNTPGSVHSCGPMQTTPEMQQSFMSPMQAMQPSSVHAVQSNGAMDPGWTQAPQSDPSTPLRNVHSAGSFGSPPGASVQGLPGAVQSMRASVDAPTNSRRSGESTRKRNQQQQQQQQQQQLQQQLQHQNLHLHSQHFAMTQQYQMTPMQHAYAMQHYQQSYPPAWNGFPDAYQANIWQNAMNAQSYNNQHYNGKVNGATMGNVVPPVVYPNYPNVAQNLRYPNTGFTPAHPGQFQPFLPYPNPPYNAFYKP